MNLNSKHLKAMLCVKHLKEHLLVNSLTEFECINYESLSAERQSQIKAQVIFVMNNGFAEHLVSYSHPDDQQLDPVKVYGEQGIYMVCELDSHQFTLFASEQEAVDFANAAYDNWAQSNSFDDQ